MLSCAVLLHRNIILWTQRPLGAQQWDHEEWGTVAPSFRNQAIHNFEHRHLWSGAQFCRNPGMQWRLSLYLCSFYIFSNSWNPHPAQGIIAVYTVAAFLLLSGAHWNRMGSSSFLHDNSFFHIHSTSWHRFWLPVHKNCIHSSFGSIFFLQLANSVHFLLMFTESRRWSCRFRKIVKQSPDKKMAEKL